MAHIHTGEKEIDLTASAFIVRKFPDEQWRILLHRHKKLGKLLQFGGHVELDETPWEAIAHELKEESGYDIASLELFLSPPLIGLTNCVEQPAPFSVNTHLFSPDGNHRHTDLSYAFIANDDPRQLPAEGEAQEFSWLNDAEVEELPEAEIFSNVRQLARFVLQKAAEL
jgi:8-oxo-dGTP pyrophosphatase MutT (NUDIX family)